MPEDSLGGSMAGNINLGPSGRGNLFQRAIFGKGLTGSVQASLKFDIPGLEAFRVEIGKIKDAIKTLGESFKQLAAAPKTFSTELEKINKQLVDLNKNAGNVKNIKLLGTGDKSAGFAGAAPAPSASQAMSPNALPPGQQGAGAAAAGAMGGSLGGIVTKVLSAPFDRIQQGGDAAKSNDVWLSRLALSTGRTGRQEQQNLGRGVPFLGTSGEISQTMYALQQQGYVVGGGGIGGQRGAAAATSIRSLQSLSPGLGAPEAASMVMGSAANISAQRQAVPLFGQAAMAYTAGGQLKTLPQRYQEVLDLLKSRRQGSKAGVAFTKDELIASQVPGSVMHAYLNVLGWDESMIGQFFAYAIASTQYGPGFTGTEEQMKKVRGPSIAESQAELTAKKAERDFKYGGDQYKTILAQQEVEKSLVGALTGLDSTMKGLNSILGRLPSGWGQQLAQVAGAATNVGVEAAAAAGDPPGLSQLNPDVRARIGNMMAANPSLQVVSGRRTDLQQKRMYESGNPFMAPPGRSHHTRGAAADLGPASQYGWIKNNARKFGLDHAAGMGEPWHVQLAGTMFGIGDISAEERAASMSAFQGFAQQVNWSNWQKEQAAHAPAAAGGAAGAIKSGVDTAAAAISGAVAAGTTGASTGSGTGPMTGKVPLETVVKALYAAGFRGQDLVNMAAIPSRESGYRADATNLSTQTKDQSYGLWQINVRKDANYATAKGVLGSEDWTQLYDPYVSAKVAFEMYTRNGNTLRPWGGYKGKSNTYNVSQGAFDAAQAEVTALGYGDLGYGAAGGSGGGASNSNVSVNHAPATFNNVFNISVSGGGSGDVTGLVRQIASKLEVQMQRVQATRH